MNNTLKNPISSLIIGLVVGAAIVGGVWYTNLQTSSGGGVMAKVGNTAISRVAFQTQLEATSGSSTLGQLISNQLIADGAKKYNVTASQSEINTALQSLEQQNNITSAAQLQAGLASAHMTMADLNTNLRYQVLEQKLASRNVTVTDKEIQDYYNKNKAQLSSSGKTPTLASVKTMIAAQIKQSKSTPAAQLLASLAKTDPIQILDKKYSSLKTTIENPAPATQSPTSTGP